MKNQVIKFYIFGTVCFLFSSNSVLLSLNIGDKVKCQWKQRGNMYKGKVADKKNGKILLSSSEKKTKNTKKKNNGTKRIQINRFEQNKGKGNFEANASVLVKKNGMNVRGWIVRPDGPDHSYVAFTWNAESVARYPNSSLMLNKYANVPDSKKRLTAYKGYEPGVYQIAAGKNGKYFLLITSQNTAVIFEKETFIPVSNIKNQKTYTASGIAMSHDGKTLAICNYKKNQVQLFSVPELKLKQRINVKDDCRRLAFSSNNILAFHSHGTGFYLYDYINQKISSAQFPLRYGSQEKYTHTVATSLEFSVDGKKLYVGIEVGKNAKGNRGVLVFSVNGINLKKEDLIETPDNVYSVDTSNDGKYLAIGGKSTVALANLRKGKLLWSKEQTIEFIKVAFSPSSQSIALVSHSGDYHPRIADLSGNIRKLSRTASLAGNVFFTDNNTFYISRNVNTNFGEPVVLRYDLRFEK
jgi:WD40 repeat protein